MTEQPDATARRSDLTEPDWETLDEAAALARLYDVDVREDPGDLDLYRALAGRTGGPVLELAVGSGRVAVPLVRDGHEVTGVDLDPAMLDRARAAIVSAGRAAARRLRLHRADARDVRLPEAATFRLAIIALNSLLLMGDRGEQVRAIATLARHLAPDGLAVVDVWLPDADQLAAYDGRVGLEYVRTAADGSQVIKLASARHDSGGHVHLTAIYDVARPGESVRRWVREDRLRLVGPEELVAMAEAVGLRIEQLAGDYDLRPYEPGDERAILIASPGPAAIRRARAQARRRSG